MKKSSDLPFPFVLEELEKRAPYTKPMFGLTGVYVDEKIVFGLRNREKFPEDNGVWVATSGEHHESLKKLIPSLRSLVEFGPGPTGWQVIPVDSPAFEEEVFRACALVLKNDPRIGKVPKSKRPRGKIKKKSSPKARAKKK